MNLDNIHFISNLFAGLSFWGVSYFFSNFITTLRLRTSDDSDEKLWIQISKFSSVFSIISAVFFFCGFGHVIEAFRPWLDDYGQMIVIHCCTASLGIILCSMLFYYTYLVKNKK